MATCYRHSSRETGVSCSACGRPICPDCMTPTPVGMRCPECSRERTRVRTARTLAAEPTVTYALIAINVLAYLGELASGAGAGFGVAGGQVVARGELFGPAIANGHEYWRLLTSGFLHGGLGHLFFNMLFIYFLGRLLEPAYGHARFAAVYFASLLAGSFGALVLTPHSGSLGASGAAFGLLGAAIVAARARGIPIWQSGLGITLAINVVFTFTLPQISIGAHVFGLIAGAVIGLLIEVGSRRRSGATALALPLAGSAALAVVAVAGSIIAAQHAGLG